MRFSQLRANAVRPYECVVIRNVGANCVRLAFEGFDTVLIHKICLRNFRKNRVGVKPAAHIVGAGYTYAVKVVKMPPL